MVKPLDLGLVDFETAGACQQTQFDKVKSGVIPCAFIFCRLKPVITFGNNSRLENILFSKEELAKRGIGIQFAARGGDVTYHGPGQLVVYPIIDLKAFRKDIKFYLATLEQSIINCLHKFGIPSQRKAGFTGVWSDDCKVSSIGIGVRNWVTFYGLSINIEKDDLEAFGFIRPCGLDCRMTSLEGIADKRIDIEKLKQRLFSELLRNFHN